MPRGSTCKAKGCTSNKNDNPDLSFHSFPRNKERFKLWCDLIKRPDLNHGKALTSRMSMRVCSLHFEDHMYMSPTNKSRLIWCAVPKPLEIKEIETGETAPLDHLLPEADPSDKTDAYSSDAEDIIIKEESDMDQDINTDISVPTSFPHEDSPVGFFADTKVGILEQTQSGQCVKERVDSKSFQDDPESYKASCSTKSNTLGSTTNSSSQLETMSLQTTFCLPSSSVTQMSTPSNCAAVLQESPSYQLEPSKSSSTGLIPDTVVMNVDFEKSKVDMETTYKAEKTRCSEDCGCDKCFAAAEIKKKAGAIKNITRRTYSGPIRRQVVRTKGGGKRTIMIVNKASLKNLQAKGLIQPVTTKYMVHHPRPLQSSKKNVIPHVIGAGNLLSDPLKFSQSEDSLLKGVDSSRKSSSIQVQPSTDEKCTRESSTESRDETYAPSHTFETPKPHITNNDSQTPVTVSWAPVNGSNALSFTFTVTLPAGTSRHPGISQDPLQIATSLLNNGAQYTVNQPDAQGREPLHRYQMSGSQSSSNSGISSNLRTKGSKESIAAHSIISGLTSQHPLQKNTPDLSSKYVLPSITTHIPRKTTDMDNDSCLSKTTSPTRSASSATLTHKHPNHQSFYITLPNLSGERGSEEKKIHCSKNLEGNTEDDQSTKTRPKKRDSVQWIALPSSSGVPEQIHHQTGLTGKCQIFNTTLHHSEQSNDVYVACPTSSLDEKDKRLHISPSYRSINKELKLKYTELLKKHRRRYYLLMKKYKLLEEKFSAIKDVGTPQQIIRDAQKFLSEEHVLFLGSQMFLRNRCGAGNRFSRKFMKLMIEYYKRSGAGYRFLRTIFNIPSVKTIQKWLCKAIELEDSGEDAFGESREDSETGNDEGTYPPLKIQCGNIYQDSSTYKKSSQATVSAQNLENENNSADDYDSEESDLEEMEEEEAERKC